MAVTSGKAFAVFLFVGVTSISTTSEAKSPRSSSVKAEFKRLQPCPATGNPRGACPGYIIDHVKALACGGEDAASNMQWQTVAEAKAKDRWERKGCGTKAGRARTL